jgi:hypothetical protein
MILDVVGCEDRHQLDCRVVSSKARLAYLRCRFAKSECADRRPASLTSCPIGVVLNIPVIDRDCLLPNF